MGRKTRSNREFLPSAVGDRRLQLACVEAVGTKQILPTLALTQGRARAIPGGW
jgi:hypothetical protein